VPPSSSLRKPCSPRSTPDAFVRFLCTVCSGCRATNAAGLTHICSTGNPALLDMIDSIGPESYVYFQWNTDGACSYLLVEQNSRFKPAAVSGD
jgi:hypothetical protein